MVEMGFRVGKPFLFVALFQIATDRPRLEFGVDFLGRCIRMGYKMLEVQKIGGR
jgi:hypothetical protein